MVLREDEDGSVTPFSTPRESRGCETDLLDALRRDVAAFSTLRESRGCETPDCSPQPSFTNDFQYSPRVEGV